MRTLLALLLCGLFLRAACAAPVAPEAEAEQAFAQAMRSLEAGEWAQAELLFERSLMLNPEHAAARLELAALLARRGRLEAARALIESLVDDPRTPPEHRGRLQAMLAETDRALAAVVRAAREGADPVAALAPPAETTAEIYAGWSRNPLARADLRQLTLTFPEGSITLPVARDVRPAGLTGVTLRHGVSGDWGFQANLERIFGNEDSTAHRLSVQGRLPWSGRGAVGWAQWSAQTQRAYDGATRHALGVSVGGRDWRLSGGGFDEPGLERRGIYLRLEGASRLRPDVQALAYAEVEHAWSGPPSFVRLGAMASWAPAPHWVLLGHVGAHRDLSGYSPLLEGGAAREMLSANLSLERAWEPGPGNWQVLGRLYGGGRWSNLDLFTYRDAGVQVSLRRRWQ